MLVFDFNNVDSGNRGVQFWALDTNIAHSYYWSSASALDLISLVIDSDGLVQSLMFRPPNMF